MIPTYDQKQLSADLRRCSTCGRSYWMTAPQTVCLRCQQQAHRLYTPQEASNLFGISANAILLQIHAGQIQAVKIHAGQGWRYGIPRSEIERVKMLRARERSSMGTDRISASAAGKAASDV